MLVTLPPALAALAPPRPAAAQTASAGSPAPAADASPRFRRALIGADSILEAAVAAERIPGAVLLVTRDGRLVHERAFGYARLYDYGPRRLEAPEPMTIDHLFDLASVTKVMATTFALMLLVDRGAVDLDAPVSRYLSGFDGARWDSITARHLLSHGAGLLPWQPIYYHARTAEQARRRIRELPPAAAVSQARRYSDLGFMLLGYLVEAVAGRPLDAFLQAELYRPLGLESTAFNPRARGLGPFAATSHGNPYERRMVHDTAFGYRVPGDPHSWNGWRDYTLSGEVNDGNAWYAHGGVAGHAGLFSTARELGTLLELLLGRGEHRGRRVIRAEVVDTFLTRGRFGHGLGWQLPDDLPARSFAHTGFTGTYVLGVPAHRLGIVLLINRQNLGVDEQGRYPNVDPLRRAVARALIDAAESPSPETGNAGPPGH